MPIDLIAAAVVSKFLVPAVKNGTEQLMKSIGEKVGDEAARHTEGLLGKLWQRVGAVFSSDSDRATLASFKQDPEVYEDAVQKLLTRKLEADPALADELARLVDEKVPGTNMAGAQVVNAGVVGINDLRNANLSGAQNMTFVGASVGSASATSPPAPTQEPGA